MATVSAGFPCKSANPSAPQPGTTPTKITLAPLIHPAFPFENDQSSQRLALNPHKPRYHRRTQTAPRFPPSRLFGRLPPSIRSRLRTAGVRKPLTIPDLPSSPTERGGSTVKPRSPLHWMTLSERARRDCGMIGPSGLAVLRLIGRTQTWAAARLTDPRAGPVQDLS